MIILTIDLGTTATKAGLWDDGGLRTIARSAISTQHPRPGWSEQDPLDWWRSVLDACATLRAELPDVYARTEAIGFSAARETFAPFDADLNPLGPGILWSDQRGGAGVLHFGDPDEFRARTGVVLNAACCAAKVAWLVDHAPDVFARARWLLAPRDFVAARLTGTIATDETLASRTGLYALDGALGVAAPIADALPPLHPPATVMPAESAVTELGLPPGIAIVLGGGDRACEVLGVGGDAQNPMVSWGTTANVSIPHPGPPNELPTVAAVSRGALGGFLVEAGLSASGAAMEWLARLTGRPTEVLLVEAAASPPGANGVTALPWLHGARGPWWRPDALAAFAGLSAASGPGELARSVIEAVAYDVARCLELIAPDAAALMLAGGGARNALWRDVLAATTKRPVVRRSIDEAASVGARMIVGEALGQPVDPEALNPIADRYEPDPELVDRYQEARRDSDALARAVLDLSPR